jgi:hypothetical protein
LEKYIRNYNYIADFYRNVYELYSSHYPAYPITYYNFDPENSVYDEKMMGGSYEKNGLGELSGVKFRKIQQLPVYGVEAIQPSYTGSETGFTTTDSEMTSITFPTIYGIVPYPGDVVLFNQEFMMKGLESDVAFVVKNKELATYGDITHYRLRLGPAGSGRGNAITKVEKQISSRYFFLESTKKIHPTEIALIMLNLESNHTQCVEKVNDKVHTIGFYLQP